MEQRALMALFPLDQNTVGFAPSTEAVDAKAVMVLTLLQHPDWRRVGQMAVLFSSALGGVCALSRAEPDFYTPGTRGGEPIARPTVSRSPVLIRGEPLSGDAMRVVIDPAQSSTKVLVNGRVVTEPLELTPAELDAGVVLDLAQAVLLLLQWVPLGDGSATTEPVDDLGIFGESPAIRRVRQDIRRVADLESCVLIRGESGSGKELVARAIHRCSPRNNRPYVAVNMGAIPPTVAASMLFGHARGAFTGASEASLGFFRQADRGTLFLDEIGEAPLELQPALLRAIREGEVQPVGEATVRKVSVRLLSATDANLEDLVARGKFGMPLLRRIEGFTLHVPPLRSRRDDVARLFFRFLAQEFEQLGESHKLNEPAPGTKPWLPTAVLEALLDYPFPGNVAELKTLTQQLVITNRGLERFVMEPRLADRLGVGARIDLATRLGVPKASSGRAPADSMPSAARAESAPAAKPPVEEERPMRRDPTTLTDQEVVTAMREHRFKVKLAALALGVSRSWLNTRLEDCQGVRKANSLAAAEIQVAGDQCGWKTPAMAEVLEVSEHGLKLRMRALDLS
jgi:two-component system, NtrC family, nitrogen regulation response regulator GlnG